MYFNNMRYATNTKLKAYTKYKWQLTTVRIKKLFFRYQQSTQTSLS
jgi:hypothetical protein